MLPRRTRRMGCVQLRAGFHTGGDKILESRSTVSSSCFNSTDFLNYKTAFRIQNVMILRCSGVWKPAKIWMISTCGALPVQVLRELRPTHFLLKVIRKKRCLNDIQMKSYCDHSGRHWYFCFFTEKRFGYWTWPYCHSILISCSAILLLCPLMDCSVISCSTSMNVVERHRKVISSTLLKN